MEQLEFLELSSLAKLLNSNHYDPAVIILDLSNKEILHTEVSHLLRIKHPYARQILYIDDELTTQQFQQIKNLGSFNFLIDDSLDGLSLELKMKSIFADYQIVKIMGEELKNPHPHSPAFEIMKGSADRGMEFLGYIISVYSVVKIAELKDPTLQKQEIILGAYLSAISEKMIYSGVTSDEPWVLNLGTIELFIHECMDILYVFIYRNLNDVDRIQIIDKMKGFTSEISKAMGENLLHSNYILSSDIRAIDEEIRNYKLDADVTAMKLRIPKLVFVDPPQIIHEVIPDLPENLLFSIVPSFQNLKALIQYDDIDVVCIQTDSSRYRDLIEELEVFYRIAPAIRFILYFSESKDIDYSFLLESKVVDYIILEGRKSTCYSILELASTDTITSQLYDLDVQRLYLRNSAEKYVTATMKERGELYIPVKGIELASIYIIADKDIQFHYEWADRDQTLTILNESIFDFTDSFRALSSDLAEGEDHVLFEFGRYTLLYYKLFIFDFIIIVKNADPSKYNEGLAYLKMKSVLLTEIILRGLINSDPDTYFELNIELDTIFLDLVSLNFL